MERRRNPKGSLKTNPSNQKTVWLNTKRFYFSGCLPACPRKNALIFRFI